MTLKINEVAKLAGVSVRTLHHYDDIGLLQPTLRTDAGYRLYTENDLATLQQILFFKELDFTLKEIKNIVLDPSFNRIEALELQRKMLLKKRAQLNKMLETIDDTIQHEKGEVYMSQEKRFTGFDFSKNKYEQEAREKWGNKVVDKANATINKTNKIDLSEKMNDIYHKLAVVMHHSPSSSEAQNAIASWYAFLNKYTGHHYSLAAFKGLGQMYVADERFTENIDQFGEGLAQFMCEAMEVYAEQNKET